LKGGSLWLEHFYRELRWRKGVLITADGRPESAATQP
jgi:deoxyribodipyrimidine photolyase-like uncharacterized protein